MVVLVSCTSECRDCEAGTGWHTRSAWRPSARETTVDFTPSLVNVARHRLAHEQLLEAIREKDDYKLILAGQVRASGAGPCMNPELAALASACVHRTRQGDEWVLVRSPPQCRAGEHRKRRVDLHSEP